MRTIIFGFLSIFFSIAYSNPKLETFLQELTLEQKGLLDRFFRFIAKDSFSGYVLYGDKPICIEAHILGNETGAIGGFNDAHAILVKAIDLWESFNLTTLDKNYFFLSHKDSGHRHFICINRNAFIQAVNNNLSLFRYVLGPTMTAEGLLHTLIQSKESFYDVLKNDNVLLGILLGYGTQNALLVSRKEMISNAFAYDCIEDFPFISRNDRMERKDLPKMQTKRPSLGFTSLNDEIKCLQSRSSLSRKLLPFASTKIPYFGCEADHEETKNLLITYENNRNTILKILESENFLEETLCKLLATTSNTLDIPKVPAQQLVKLPNNKEELVAKFSYEELKREPFFQESFIEDFLKGISVQEQSKERIYPQKMTLDRAWEQHYLEQDFRCCEGLQTSNRYFESMRLKKDLIPLVAGKIYYKVLMEGEGSPTSRKLSKVSLHTSYSILNDTEVKISTIVQEDIGLLIPGVAHTLIGMKKGEKREIHIHPEYGYGKNSFLPPNSTLIAYIELVDFEEGTEEAIIAPLQKLTEKNIEEVASKLTSLHKVNFYESGLEFYNHYKKTIDFTAYKKELLKTPQKNISVENPNEFLTNLLWVSQQSNV